jgi:predicted permease
MIIETFVQDLRVGARVLFKEKTFCFLAVTVLALGIAAVTTQFSVVNGTVLRGLPFPASDRLINVLLRDPTTPPETGNGLSAPDYEDVVAQQKSFEGLAAYFNGSTVNVTVKGNPQRYTGAYVTDNFFRLLRVQPILGRDFTPADNRPGAERTTIIGHAIWERDFKSDPGVVGQTVRMNGRTATIIGVMPPGFQFPSNEDIWVPLFNEFPIRPRGDPQAINPAVLGRLHANVTLDQAKVEFDALAKRLALEYPKTNQVYTESLLQPVIIAFIGQQVRQLLYVMLAAVGVVLLIACVNVMNMQLARATLRAKELAIRGALGASRIRLVRQMLTESLLLATCGAVVGVTVARWAVDFLWRSLNGLAFPLPFWIHFDIDGRVLAFTVAATVGAAVLSGLLPALLASRANSADVLKEAGRGNTSRLVNNLTRLLVIGQIALTCALLILSSLMIKSVVNQQRLNYGYDTSSVLSARMGLFEGDYPTPQSRVAFFQRALRELRASPSIASAALTSRFRMTFEINGGSNYEVEGTSYKTDHDRPTGAIEHISDGYFSTLGIKVLEGREFNEDDSDERQPVAIVNTTFARKHFGRQSAIGRQVRPYIPTQAVPWRTIIGVVPDTLMQGPFNQQQDDAGFFIPLATLPPSFITVVLRPHGGSPDALTDTLRRAMVSIDPNLPLYFPGTPKRMQDEVLAQNRIIAALFMIFGLVAVVLASVGLYGVMAFSVSQRTSEFGIRMALGAAPRNILRMVLRQGVVQLATGLGIGLAAAVAFSLLGRSLLNNVFFRVNLQDPLIYGAVIMLLSLVAWVSCLVPARRATRVDPMIALRAE